MRIACPFCGERGSEEFSYAGDASLTRPEASQEAFVDYVYFRSNLAGTHRELWYHGSACRQFLQVERDTRTHDILSVHAV